MLKYTYLLITLVISSLYQLVAIKPTKTGHGSTRLPTSTNYS